MTNVGEMWTCPKGHVNPILRRTCQCGEKRKVEQLFPPRPTPTDLAADIELARKWYRCPSCFTGSPACSPTHVLEVGQMAAEIAAAREAHTQEVVQAAVSSLTDQLTELEMVAAARTDEVAALVEAGQGWIDALTLMPSLGAHDSRQRVVVVKLELAEQQMRAALERVRKKDLE